MNRDVSQLLNTLNPEQQTAVYSLRGTKLVCAGAGSGKTRIIIARIAYLIESGIPPESILAVTFTNKAAREMKERLAALLPDTTPFPYIGTFHGFCLFMLKRYRTTLGIEDFSILDESDQRKLVHTILKRLQLDKEYKPRSVLSYMSHRKNSLASSDSGVHETLEQVRHIYEQEKCNAYCYDFDDLLGEMVTHLRTHHAFRQRLHAIIQHILVDEYQDTNTIQHELLKLLTHDNGELQATSICVVGDEDQSIYRWRGATVDNFVLFHHDFPDTQRITITQNYRSCPPILQAANSVIQHNDQRYAKALWSQKSGRDRIVVAQCASHIQEGQLIAYAVQSALRNGQQPAVLYRSHYQSRSIEEALIQHNIAYTIIAGTEFYQRQEIKDIIAYLRLLTNPYDHISWSRICNVPRRSLGAKFQDQFLHEWRNSPLVDHTTIAHRLKPSLGPQKARALSSFVQVFEDVTPDQSVYHVCTTIIERIQYKTYLQRMHEEDEAQEKIENIHELQRALYMRSHMSVQAFLEEITLMHNHNTQENGNDHVQLMTLHAAKGLEFPVIILAGLEENVFPSTRSRYDDASLEEERRLFYVGLTRAQERVIITYAQYRATFGTIQDNPPSRFISELPHDVIRHEHATWMHDTDIHTYMHQWMTGNAPVTNNQKASAHEPRRPTQQKDEQPGISSTRSAWKHGQAVWHPRFGRGRVSKVTHKSSSHTYLTIQFQRGAKKLDAQFITSI